MINQLQNSLFLRILMVKISFITEYRQLKKSNEL